MNLSERIKFIRGKLSAVEFCEPLSIHKNTLYGYESGKNLPNADVLEGICRHYDVNPTWLLMGEGPIRPGEGSGKIAQLEDPTITELKLWLNELRGDEPGIYFWFRVELQKKFPEYKEWLDKKRVSESFEISGTG